MRSQIYGILGLMYTLAIGILLVVALVGTSKQFTWQSSAPMYKFAMMQLSSSVQQLRTFLSQERVYAVDRALFYTGAFGGYSTFHDLVPKEDAKICGCPSGSKPVNKNGDSCSSSDTQCFCNDTSTGKLVHPNMCFESDDGKKLDVGMVNKSLWATFPEKYFVYWYNKTYIGPDETKIKSTAEEYMDYLFSIPDPRIVVPLEILGTEMNFHYVTEIKNFSNEYVDVEWIPIGEDSAVFNFPINHPVLNYYMKLAVETNVRNNLFELFNKSKEVIQNKDSVFGNTSKGILPTVIDENYVINYTKKDVGSYHCNYSTSERPDGNPKCSQNQIQVNNLKPMVALIYYVDENYWDSNTHNMGAGCDSCTKPDYLSLNENDLEKSLPCTAEITSNIKNGIVQFRIDNFYGKCNNGGNLNTNVTCMMCAIVSKMNEEIGGSKHDIHEGSIHTWKYENSLSDKNYAIKIFPLEKFNITLNNVEVKTHNWTSTSFAVNITSPHPYYMSGTIGCGNLSKGGQAGADSICEVNGFQKADECLATNNPMYTYNWSYNITMGPAVSNSGYKKIDKVVCSDGKEYNINDSNGNKFSVLGRINDNSVDINYDNYLGVDNAHVSLLSFICKATKLNSSDYVDKYEIEGNVNGKDMGDIEVVSAGDAISTSGAYVKNITCSNGETYDVGFEWNAWGHGCGKYFSNFSGGKPMADIFCKVFGSAVNPINATQVCFEDGGSDRHHPILDINITKSTQGQMAVTKIWCHSGGSFYLSSNINHVKNAYYLNLIPFYVPWKLVDIYQPDNFANQREILERICPNGKPRWVVFDDSGPTAHLILDTGKEGDITVGYALNKITCVIK